ncbi:TRAP transporter small permease subunit [Pseudomaricurvus alkylphenolicus]|jgi:TRAP-type mannitol/chloroaromatic compound transport system permease small subunit|uniref:TRAP transporter small permease subunit n=1 Tax=Pseudomaricurvus alkylphenolicus TaxID=1306991 RepID=UPI0014206E3C|nr:TRAP transporter small permease subunit [Pseudomaricurvus alkylphenolicus]NIB38766.1 TRAP transporter small permease subunit [Pseudomaricurvus alkylphenolicus]
MRVLTQQLNRFIDLVGILCAILMVLMLANVFYDVVMRYLFNTVSIAMQELEWHLFAAMFMFGIGYTLKENGHVRVDIFFENLSVRKQAIINIIGTLVFTLPISYLILSSGYGYAQEAFLMNEGSGDPGGLPHRWIIRAVIPASTAFLMLCALQVMLTEFQHFIGAKEETEQ